METPPVVMWSLSPVKVPVSAVSPADAAVGVKADKAMTDAMNVFWQHGYDAASLPFLL